MRITIFANACHTVSGGDKIFAQFARHWIKWGELVQIVTNEKGGYFASHEGIPKRYITIWPSSRSDAWGTLCADIYKSAIGFLRGMVFQTEYMDVVFSASYIWPDLIPGLIAKLKNPSITWVVGWYLFMPNPISGENQTGGVPFRQSLYYLMQSLSYVVVKQFADVVLTASQKDTARFNGKRKIITIAVRGGVDVESIRAVKKSKHRYDAVFVGRFHYQKNIDGLFSIWQKVVSSLPKSKLAVVGGGELEPYLRHTARALGLSKNITFLGIVDGRQKIRILKSSSLFVSASLLDSGNIALDEALASGVPGVIYNLPHLRYGRGVVKVPQNDAAQFARTVITLLTSRSMRIQLGYKAASFGKTLSWETKARIARETISEEVAKRQVPLWSTQQTFSGAQE